MNLRDRAAVSAGAAPASSWAALLERLAPVGDWNLLKKAIER